MLIYVLEYEYNTIETPLSDNKMILLKIQIPFDKYVSCSKFYCSNVKFILVYCSIL